MGCPTDELGGHFRVRSPLDARRPPRRHSHRLRLSRRPQDRLPPVWSQTEPLGRFRSATTAGGRRSKLEPTPSSSPRVDRSNAERGKSAVRVHLRSKTPKASADHAALLKITQPNSIKLETGFAYQLNPSSRDATSFNLVDGATSSNVVEPGRVAGDSIKCELYFR